MFRTGEFWIGLLAGVLIALVLDTLYVFFAVT